MTCPLPVDWLDFLEGQRPDLAEHLERCASCTAVVARLQAAKPGVSRSWLDHVHLESVAQWHEDRPTNPSVGELWLTRSELEDPLASYADLDRVAVVVLVAPEEDHARSWVDVAPIATDIENATSLDLLIAPDENTVGTSWRILFRDQLSLAVEQLDTRFGSLTGAGQELLALALDGDLEYARTGVAVESDVDPRIATDSDRRGVLVALGSLRARAEEIDDEDHRDDETSADVIALPRRSKRISFWIRTDATEASWGRLAAADTPMRTRRLMDAAWDQSRLDGFLRWDARRDRLLFKVRNVENINARVRIFCRVRDRSDELMSEAFVPHEGEEITIVEGAGVPDHLVDRVELELER